MPASERERAFLARMGKLKAASHQKALAAHLDLTLVERLNRSWALFETFRGPTALAPRHSGASAFFARARTLGLYLHRG